MNKSFMFLPLNKKVFNVMFDAKSDKINPIIEYYETDSKNLYNILWDEFNIPGMEIRMANTAFDYLIDCCTSNKDLCKTLKSEIKNCIMMSVVFYTNVAPKAAWTSDFKR